MLDETSNGDSAPQKPQKRARHVEPDSRDKDALPPAKATQNGAASKAAKPSGAENAQVAAIKRECAPTSPTATECAKTDSSGRFSKPRKKGRAPSVVYFKDSLPMAVEGESLVGSVIRVWWDGNRKWFQGRVIKFQTDCPWVDFVQPHLIRYDDGDIRWHELEGKVTGEGQTYPILVILALLNSARCSFIASPNYVLEALSICMPPLISCARLISLRKILSICEMHGTFRRITFERSTGTKNLIRVQLLQLIQLPLHLCQHVPRHRLRRRRVPKQPLQCLRQCVPR